MQSKTKIFLAVAIAALIVVVGLIAVSSFRPASPAAPEATSAPEATPAPEATQEPAQDEDAEAAAPEEDIPEEQLYEGALAGLSEEEIGRMAMAEENVSIDDLGEDGVD